MKPAAIIGIGLQVLSSGKSLFEGLAQKKKVAEAERQSAEALINAKNRLEVNRMEGIQVPLESYEMAMRETTAQTKQGLEGLREAGPRALAAGVGKLKLAGAQAIENNRKSAEKALIDRAKLIADQDELIDRSLASLSLQEAIGFEKEARDKETMGAAQISSGIEGLGNAALTYYKNKALYEQQDIDNPEFNPPEFNIQNFMTPDTAGQYGLPDLNSFGFNTPTTTNPTVSFGGQYNFGSVNQ